MEERYIDSEARDLDRDLRELLRTWNDAQNMQRQLDDFNENHQPPEPPSRFEGARDLVEYNRKRRRYEKQLHDFSKRAADYRRGFEQESIKLLERLPEGVPLIYSYQGYGTSLGANTYEIQKIVTEDQPSIQIREIDED